MHISITKLHFKVIFSSIKIDINYFIFALLYELVINFKQIIVINFFNFANNIIIIVVGMMAHFAIIKNSLMISLLIFLISCFDLQFLIA